MQPILSLENIHKSFPGVKALNGASLQVYSGQVMALIGENGAGKSTLMKIITGIYTKDEGTITYQGKLGGFNGPKQSQEAGISIIHQELNLISELTIAENIFLGREPTNAFGKIQWAQLYHQSDRLLERLRVTHSSRTRVGDLSIGDKQMVEIAKALSFDSKVIIMDEPTDALTDKESASLFAVIHQLKMQNYGIVYISHRLPEVFQICDQVTVLRDGQFVKQSPVEALTEDKLIELMVGRPLHEQYPRVDVLRTSRCFSVDHFSGHGIHDINFHVDHGEILGISGLMGAGRTELMKMIYGALPYDHGTMTLDDQKIQIRTPSEALKQGIVYISEDRKGDGLVLNQSVQHNMSLCALNALSSWYGIHGTEEGKQVQHFVQQFNIKTPALSQSIQFLSGGNQQKVAIAKGLMINPKLLILDEPTRGVDVGAKKEIYQLINQFKISGMSIILISSDMPEVLGMSDRILVMYEGQISGEFDRVDANQERLMACAVGQKISSSKTASNVIDKQSIGAIK